MSSYFVLVTGWALYFFFHSFLASSRVKRWICTNRGPSPRIYRQLYNAFSILGLVMVLFLNGAIDSDHIIPATAWTRWVGLALATWGLIIIRLAFKTYSIKEFLGIEPELEGQQSVLSTGGILNRVRHPIYSGTILILLGFWLFDPRVSSLVSVLCTFVYLGIGIRLEERKLVDRFGEKYVQYCRKVPMLIPRIF